ncbi:MAG TPA: LamB/YcsF family protein, partial [Flavisolibacter sp.]|nr:LamB/YcsF family protein [Flavisolibacter sp.]
AAGLKVANEVFADRAYAEDGSLVPRSMEGAMIEDVNQALHQVKQMVNEGSVTSFSGKIIPIVADTVCIHGDQRNAVLFARKIKEVLAGSGKALMERN